MNEDLHKREGDIRNLMTQIERLQ